MIYSSKESLPLKGVFRASRFATRAVWLSLASACMCANVNAAQGEMGTGIPSGFSFYSAATGVQTLVWGMTSPSIQFPSGCQSLTLTPATMGMDAYKIAVSTLLLARVTGRPVRFYAHASRDTGCGVDYIQLNEP